MFEVDLLRFVRLHYNNLSLYLIDNMNDTSIIYTLIYTLVMDATYNHFLLTLVSNASISFSLFLRLLQKFKLFLILDGRLIMRSIYIHYL